MQNHLMGEHRGASNPFTDRTLVAAYEAPAEKLLWMTVWSWCIVSM